jgi:hypothetical protein
VSEAHFPPRVGKSIGLKSNDLPTQRCLSLIRSSTGISERAHMSTPSKRAAPTLSAGVPPCHVRPPGNPIQSIRWIGLALMSGAVITACAHAPPTPVVKVHLLQMTASVERIDLSSRMVVVRAENGLESIVVVGPQVRNLDQVHVGDRISLSYYSGIAAEVKKTGSAVHDPLETSAQVRAQPGQRPSAVAVDTLKVTVKIESVDTSLNTVTFQRPDGIVRTVAIEDANVQRFIRELHRGDEVDLTYTEAVAVGVTPAP